MKTRKFTKVISFILSVALVISSVAITSMVSAAHSTITTTYECPKSLCFKELIISGPYGDPNETVDSGVPYLGGMTYQAVMDNHYETENDYHLYIIYCPKYDNSNSSLLRHTMTLMFAKHGYTTMSYTQFNSSYHYANKVCDHGTDFKGSNVYALTQELCGENAYLTDETMVSLADEYQAQNGCGKEAAALESHTWGYGDWYDAGNSYHARNKYCIYCGYSTTETQDHDMIKGEWFNYGSENPYDETYDHSIYHQRDTVCSICNYTESEHAEHEMVIKSDWHSVDDSWHSMTKECPYCLYTAGYEANHHFTDTATHTYEQLDETQHTSYMPCDECGFVKTETSNHNFVYGDWTDNGNGTCTRTKNCSDCGYSETETQDHNYTYDNWVCDTNDKNCSNAHRRNKTCTDCGYSEKEYENHSEMFEWDQDSWQQFSEELHHRSQTCTVCGQTKYSYSVHHYNASDDTYVILSADEHERTQTCYECGQLNVTTEAHSFTASTVYTQFSESQHQIIQTCKCGEKLITYADHTDTNSDCYCDKCGYLMTKFSVTLPTTMNFVMSKTGEVYSADNVQILNNSTAAVSVKQVNLETLNGWSLTEYDETAIASAKVDSKIIGLKLNTAETATAGTTDSFTLDDWIIEKDTSIPIPYDAVVSATSTPIENEQVMNVVFIVDWKE